MNGGLLATWLGIATLTPLHLGDVLNAGLHTSGRLIEAVALIDGRPVLYEDPALAIRPVQLVKDTRIVPRQRDRLAALLRAHSIHLIPVPRLGRNAVLYVAGSPDARPDLSPRYRLAVVQLVHADVTEVARRLTEQAEELERDLPPQEVRTRFIPDLRSNKLVIRYGSRDRLARFEAAIRELDTPVERPLRALRSWVCRHTRARETAAELERKWGDRSPLHIVVHERSNSILLRLPASSWPDAKALLERLDVRDRRH